jgi:hypothetical protein
MTLKQVLIPLSDAAAWEQALSSVPEHQYTHKHWYNHAMHIASGRDVFLYHGNSDGFSAVCPVSPRRKSVSDPLEITTPYGFSGFAISGNIKGFLEYFKSYMGDMGYCTGHIALSPLLKINCILNNEDLFKGKKTFIINLKCSLDQIFARFSSTHRNLIRQWQRERLDVSHEKNEEVITKFIDLHSLIIKSKNISKVYNFGPEAWSDIISNEDSYLLSVSCNSKIEAMAVFIAYNGYVDYYMAASSPEGRRHTRGIINHAIEFFHNKGFSQLHLGCGVKENDDLEQFKSRFGGSAIETYSLKQIYNFDDYIQTCNKYDVDHLSRSGYFPAYWDTNKL